MAKYSTPKKSKNKTPITTEHYNAIEKTVNDAVTYIDHWARKELLALASSDVDSPLCIPISKTDYLVGKFTVKQIKDLWTVTNVNNNTEIVFSSKAAAVIYSLCEHKEQHKLAKEILKYNTDIIKLSDDLLIYLHHKKSAKIKHDTWRIDHFYIMEHSARYKLQDARNQLEKILRLAKYFKIQ